MVFCRAPNPQRQVHKVSDIMSIATIPPANNSNPPVLPDTLNDDNANANKDESSNNNETSNNDSLNGGDPGMQGEIAGKTGKYKGYGLMMNEQQKARGGHIVPSFAMASCSSWQKTYTTQSWWRRKTEKNGHWA